MMQKTIKKVLGKSFKYGTLMLWAFIVFFPLLTILFGSFKGYEEFTSTSGITPPESFLHFGNYQMAFQDGKMLLGFLNTFMLMFGGVVGSVVIGSMVAFVVNRFTFKLKKLVLFLYLLVSIVPMSVSQVATFKLIDRMGLYNTHFAPMLLYIGADVTMLYLYLQVFEKIPKTIDKAAMLEGASYFQIYLKILFPLLKPATASVVMLKMMSIYNDFYLPFLYMPGENMNTVSTSLFRFIGPNQIHWEVISAAIIISLIPKIGRAHV